MTVDPADVLFVGLGCSSPMYYRTLLPARALGADYVGVWGTPPGLGYATGIVKGQSTMPNYLDYKIVVIQQPRGEGWLDAIRQLQSRGIKVLAEIDDHLHSVGRQEDHDFREAYDQESLTSFEACLRAVDGLIVSTPWLAQAYRSFNKRAWVCRNGIDPERYAYEIPERPTVNIGWAGATGHSAAAKPWLEQAAVVMAEHPDTCFVSIGQPFAEGFKPHFGAQRALSIPFCAVEQYPAAMTMMDVALGPAGRSGFFKAKSDLRWLEAGALGIPLVGHPAVYREINDGVDGFLRINPEKVGAVLTRLVEDADLRTSVGAAAKERVLRERSIGATVSDWQAALEAVARS